MRPSLLHPRGEPHTRRRRHRHTTSLLEAIQEQPVSACDPDAERVREAGGPIDRASYACACGYLFSASVSTTVTCPHCGADQAW
jgi:rubrerythrin